MTLLDRVDSLRLEASRQLDPKRKAELGQFMSPAAIARLMASMLCLDQPEINVLDAGAGIGSLFSAVVAELCSRSTPPQAITVTAYELDALLISYLSNTMGFCRAACEQAGIEFSGAVIQEDFI